MAVDIDAEPDISIHAPRAGSDDGVGSEIGDQLVISIHAPRAGSDPYVVGLGTFNQTISIHAPRAGSDHHQHPVSVGQLLFQSTLPVRGATGVLTDLHLKQLISIHAPRAGSDDWAQSWLLRRRKFQSTLPVRGATFGQLPRLTTALEFQSTLPVRGATAKMPKTEPFILSNFHNFKKYTDRTRTKVIIKMELWINLSPFSGANRTGNLWSLLLRTLKGS